MGMIAALPGRCVSLVRGWDLCRRRSSWGRIPRFTSPCHSLWTEMALCAVLRQTRRPPRQENRTHVVLITTYCFFCISPLKQLCAFPSSLSDCQTPTGWNCSGKRHGRALTLSSARAPFICKFVCFCKSDTNNNRAAACFWVNLLYGLILGHQENGLEVLVCGLYWTQWDKRARKTWSSSPHRRHTKTNIVMPPV